MCVGWQAASSIIDYINSAQDELNIDEVNQLISILAQRKEELKFVSSANAHTTVFTDIN